MRYEEQVRRRVAFLRSARNLARSGEYANWRGVAAALEDYESCADLRRWLAENLSIRAQLDQLCRAAQKGETVPRGPRGARLHADRA